MKKILLIAFGLLFLIPSTNALAAEGGLLNNKPFKDNAGLEYYQATDNDISTSIRFGWYQMNIVTYTFEQPVEIDSYKAYSGLNSAVYYYDSNNVLLHSTVAADNRTNVRTYFSAPLQGVKKITLRPTSGNSTDWFEFDVFGTEQIANLISGKTINIGTSLDETLRTAPKLTDGSVSGREDLKPGEMYWYKFAGEKDISGYWISRYNGNEINWFMRFYDKEKNLIQTINPVVSSGTSPYVSIPTVKKVAYFSVHHNRTLDSAYNELEIYGVTSIDSIHAPVTDITETHTHNSINLEWNNPTATNFTGTTIKINGGIERNLTKETNTFSSINLTPETSYKYEITAKYTDGNSEVKSITVITDSPPEPIGEVIDLSATATHEKVNLSWTLPQTDELKHVNIYRDVVTETSLLDTLLGISTAYAAETKIFETNGTYFNDLTVNEQTTYEYTLTTTSTEGVESEGITTEVTTPKAPAPEIVGGGYEKDPVTGDFTYYWTEPTEGEVKILVGGTEYQKVAAASKQIVIPASDMKYTAFGDPNVTLIPIALNGEEGAPIKPPLDGIGSPDSIENVDVPFSATDLLKSGMGLFIVIAPFVLLALSFLLVPKLRFLLVQAFTKKEHRAERKRRFESETREREERQKRDRAERAERQQREKTEREQREQRERAERKDRLHFTEKTIGSKGSRESVIVKAERVPKERKERAVRQSRSPRGKTERAARERTPRTERGFN